MNSLADSVSFAGTSGRLGCSAAELPLLGRLPRPVRERLLASSRVERIAARSELFTKGEIPKCLHIVLNGIVDLSCSYKGNECTALMMAAGDVFMPAAALYAEPYLISAHALTASRILMIDAEVVRSEARSSTELALGLARVMAGQWRVALKIILDLKCRSPSQRLAAFLLRLHDACEAGPAAEIPFSKRQLASRIGMQPETLSRTLQTLAANGLYLRGRQIIVTNRVAAEEFCGPDPYPPASEYELGVHAL
ncbi:MAG TPA: helix-turn-helix domain-containing protein [Sphingomicrobium sp.]|nr:helix-turn-helix domain-containing protein [Sphingomicrobium sp.]